MKKCAFAAVSLCLFSAAPVYAQAIVDPTGLYTENFDSMGTAGTAPPLGWRHFTANFGSNSTWTNATDIPATGTNSVTTTPVGTPSTTLVVNNTPTANSNNGYNAALSAGQTSDRILSTAPTGIAGSILQLILQNNTGSSLSRFSISYDIVRLTAPAMVNELPGYQLFYSVDNGASFVNVAPLNPVESGTTPQVVVPNTVGVTSVTPTEVALAVAVANGDNLVLRWVDDNAVQTSPDQILGLNNVVFQASVVPEPSSLTLLGMALVGALIPLGRRFARRRTA